MRTGLSLCEWCSFLHAHCDTVQHAVLRTTCRCGHESRMQAAGPLPPYFQTGKNGLLNHILPLLALGDFSVEMSICAKISDSLVVGKKQTFLDGFLFETPPHSVSSLSSQLATVTNCTIWVNSAILMSPSFVKCYINVTMQQYLSFPKTSPVEVRFLDPMFTMLQSWSVSNISANFLAGLMHWCLKSKLHTKMIKAYHVNLDAKKQNPSHSRHHGFQHLRFKKRHLMLFTSLRLAASLHL